VGRFRWISVLLLAFAAVLVSTVPRVDSPETAFNETDAPVNLAPSARPTLQLVPPAVNPIAISPAPPLHRAGRLVTSLVLELAAIPSQRHGNSLQEVLCTFLI
jgi:hypothetical protein